MEMNVRERGPSCLEPEQESLKGKDPPIEQKTFLKEIVARLASGGD